MRNQFNITRRQFGAAAFGAIAGGALRATPASKPNVLVFYIDDMGWADPSCYGGKLAPTPNIDALAAGGVRFTDGYVSSCVCSPSRVGIVTGRYQARTGHDSLTVRPGSELDANEITIAQYMKRAGYATSIVGKWHLGYRERFLPVYRGFDESVGSTANIGESGPQFYRGTELLDTLPGAPISTPYYTEEANRFIKKNSGNPFFLYLPFNAVHAPHRASQKWLDRFSGIQNPQQRVYAAMIAEVDDAIGNVMAKLRELKLEENTLVFCISDNGGAGPASNMGGLRGGKWKVFEGGIRVPYIVHWKGKIRSGQVSHEPVINLDVLPTALAAAGGGVKPDHELDGVDLLPLLEGKTSKLSREVLYWRFGPQWAVRRGDWKLMKRGVDPKPMLYNLASDPGESKDRADAEPARVKELLALHDNWNARMRPPRWEDQRWNGDWPETKNAKNKKKR